MHDAELKKLGLKVTAPRLRVLGAIHGSSTRHLSAEDIYRRLMEQGSDVAIGTIYRVLTQLEAAGVLSRSVFEPGKTVFELKEDEHHDHLVCLSCGRVDEFRDDVIEARQEAVAAARGYRLTEHRLALYGTCPGCRPGHASAAGG